jgi:hypothetical protein
VRTNLWRQGRGHLRSPAIFGRDGLPPVVIASYEIRCPFPIRKAATPLSMATFGKQPDPWSGLT